MIRHEISKGELSKNTYDKFLLIDIRPQDECQTALKIKRMDFKAK